MCGWIKCTRTVISPRVHEFQAREEDRYPGVKWLAGDDCILFEDAHRDKHAASKLSKLQSQDWKYAPVSNDLRGVRMSSTFDIEKNDQGQLFGPLIFMSDCDNVLKNAWAEVFPRSKQMLCHWHMMRCVWRHLFIATRDQAALVEQCEPFRSALFSQTKQLFDTHWVRMHDRCKALGLKDFWKYFLGSMDERWHNN